MHVVLDAMAKADYTFETAQSLLCGCALRLPGGVHGVLRAMVLTEDASGQPLSLRFVVAADQILSATLEAGRRDLWEARVFLGLVRPLLPAALVAPCLDGLPTDLLRIVLLFLPLTDVAAVDGAFRAAAEAVNSPLLWVRAAERLRAEWGRGQRGGIGLTLVRTPGVHLEVVRPAGARPAPCAERRALEGATRAHHRAVLSNWHERQGALDIAGGRLFLDIAGGRFPWDSWAREVERERWGGPDWGPAERPAELWGLAERRRRARSLSERAGEVDEAFEPNEG